MKYQQPSAETWVEAAEIYRSFARRFPALGEALSSGKLHHRNQREQLAKRMGCGWSVQSIDFYLSKLRRDLKRVIKAKDLAAHVAMRDLHIKRSLETLNTIAENKKNAAETFAEERSD